MAKPGERLTPDAHERVYNPGVAAIPGGRFLRLIAGATVAESVEFAGAGLGADFVSLYDIPAGEWGTAVRFGRHRVEVDGAIALGTRVAVGANGLASAGAATELAQATLIEAATLAGQTPLAELDLKREVFT